MCLREAVTCKLDTGRWPDRAVVVTFDDGYQNLHHHAMPALATYGFTATVFLVTGHIGGCNDWASAPPGLGEQRILKWPQAAELVQAGWEIGAHTRTHPDLRGLSAEEVESEMRSSRMEIEDQLDQRVESFAYPYGLASDIATAIADREFRASCATELRCATSEPLHSLPRIDSHYLQRSGQLRRLLDGRLDRYVTIRRWGRRVRALLSG